MTLDSRLAIFAIIVISLLIVGCVQQTSQISVNGTDNTGTDIEADNSSPANLSNPVTPNNTNSNVEIQSGNNNTNSPNSKYVSSSNGSASQLNGTAHVDLYLVDHIDQPAILLPVFLIDSATGATVAQGTTDNTGKVSFDKLELSKAYRLDFISNSQGYIYYSPYAMQNGGTPAFYHLPAPFTYLTEFALNSTGQQRKIQLYGVYPLRFGTFWQGSQGLEKVYFNSNYSLRDNPIEIQCLTPGQGYTFETQRGANESDFFVTKSSDNSFVHGECIISVVKSGIFDNYGKTFTVANVSTVFAAPVYLSDPNRLYYNVNRTAINLSSAFDFRVILKDDFYINPITKAQYDAAKLSPVIYLTIQNDSGSPVPQLPLRYYWNIDNASVYGSTATDSNGTALFYVGAGQYTYKIDVLDYNTSVWLTTLNFTNLTHKTVYQTLKVANYPH